MSPLSRFTCSAAAINTDTTTARRAMLCHALTSFLFPLGFVLTPHRLHPSHHPPSLGVTRRAALNPSARSQQLSPAVRCLPPPTHAMVPAETIVSCCSVDNGLSHRSIASDRLAVRDARARPPARNKNPINQTPAEQHPQPVTYQCQESAGQAERPYTSAVRTTVQTTDQASNLWQRLRCSGSAV